MDASFDVVVLGVGSMGSAACYHLAKRGMSVLGLEQSSIVHEFGSHYGQSRIIRKAYFEHPDYVPLLKRSYELWNVLEQETGTRLYTETGLLYAGRKDSMLMKGVRESAGIHDIPIEFFDFDRLKKVYPPFSLHPGHDIIFESGAGFLEPERCIEAHVEQAKISGAQIRSHEKVLGWAKSGSGYEVTTNKGIYAAEKLVLTAGAWIGGLLPQVSQQLKVTRQTVFWMATKHPDLFSPERFPCWLAETENSGDVYYGFPNLQAGVYGPLHGLKIAQHNPGQVTDADSVDRMVSAEEKDAMRAVMEEIFPGEYAGLLHTKVCLYTYSPDEHFIIDVSKDDPNLIFAAGFSGHGFKFCSVVGEVLADLAQDGKSSLPVQFLSANRFL
ncbi:MAG: N-methyl-L-tryptophan oxidase [Bacteroidetes bacterium]|nr:N-methyl-L-tryptophan oxidase [Bacteroidota bacterium]